MSAAFFGVARLGVRDARSWKIVAPSCSTDAAAIAAILFSRYVLPFEIAGLSLTIALIGAIVLAREDDMHRRCRGARRDRGGRRVVMTLNHYLVLGAALFCIGLFGVLTSQERASRRRSASSSSSTP